MKMTDRSGLTLLETTIVMVLLSVVLGAAIMVLRQGQMNFDRTVSNAVVESAGNRALNRIARRLTGAGATTLFPVPEAPLGSSAVSFQEVEGWNAGAPVWSSDAEIRLEYEPRELDNDLDDDGDGLVDEGQVVQVENLGEADERRVVLVRGVREYLEGETADGFDENGNGLEDERGLSFQLDGNEMIVRLTLLRPDPQGAITMRTLQTSISLRN